IGADDDVGIQAILSRLEKQRSSDFSINSGHNRSEASGLTLEKNADSAWFPSERALFVWILVQSTLVWSEGYSNWQPLSLVPGLLTDAPPQNAPGSDLQTPEGEKEFTDDDGTTYKWDWTLGAWVPQTIECLENNFCCSQDQVAMVDITACKDNDEGKYTYPSRFRGDGVKS
ncbi:UNVERIFIED_CONTAM: hypothetical protein Scaly_2867500, partial [Sesamum calycinum]